jgi:hypothetical protein
MFFDNDIVGSVVTTLPLYHSMHKMKSAPSGKAKNNSLKFTPSARSISKTATQYTNLPLDTPGSEDAHSAKQVFDKLSFEAKIQYLTGMTYVPQAGWNLPGLLSLKNSLKKQLTDSAISKIEGICSLYGALCSVTDATGFLCVLTMYAKTHNQASLTSQLSQLVDNLFDGYTPQSSDDTPKWLSQLKGGLHNWKLLINNPAFAKVSRVISLLVTLGVLEDASVSLGNFEIFAVEAQKKHCTSVDLMDSIIDTIAFFAEGGYMCYVTGSLSPLLFSTPKLVELEERYVRKLVEWEHARNGNLERFLNLSEAQFDKEIKVLIDDFHDLFKTTPNGTEKRIIQQKWEALTKVYTEFTAIRISGGLRKAPLAIKIFGNSGVGKSTFADITMVTVLKAMGVACTADYICTLNEADKYMSNYRSYITGVKIDDLGNTKKEFWEIAPSESIIKIVNNIREYAVMADLANKGKISIEPHCLTITTNVEEIHAGLSSYNSMSVLRRCHIHVELKVRPEFLTNNLLDSAKVIEKFGNMHSLNDIWLITLKTPIGDGVDGQNFSHYDITHTDISITDYVNLLIKRARKHNAEQKILVESFTEPSEIVNICDKCDRVVETCTCPVVETVSEDSDSSSSYETDSQASDTSSTGPESDDESWSELFDAMETQVYEPHFGERLAGHISRRAKPFGHTMRSHRCRIETTAEDFAIKTLLLGLKTFEESPYSKWTSFVPTAWIDNDVVKSTILACGEDVIGQDVATYSKRLFYSYLITALPLWRLFGWRFAMLFLLVGYAHYMLTIAGVIETKKVAYMDALVKSRETLPECFKTLRDEHVKTACGLFAALGIMYAGVQTYRALKANLAIQGKLAPKSIADIRARDMEADVWLPTPVKPLDNNGSFANQDQAANALRTSQFIVEIGDYYSEAFCYRSKCFLIPAHMLPKVTTPATFKGVCGNIKTLINPDKCFILPNTDAAMVYVANGVPAKDMTVHFEDDYVRHPILATMHGVDEDMKQFSDKTWWQFTTDVHNGVSTFPGAFYELMNLKTYEGMCMAAIVSDSRERKILGFHIGGVTGTKKGCGFAITAPQLVAGHAELLKLSPTFVPAPQGSEIPDAMLGTTYAISSAIHTKCPTNFISGDPAVVAYGTVKGRATFNSDVMQTPISEIVEAVTGVPNKHGAPKFVLPVEREDGKIDRQRWRPWYESLEVCSKPSIGFDPAQVETAMDDYVVDLKEQFDSHASLHCAEMKPLSHQETISGIEGRRFVNAMVTKTSMGYPNGGPKNNHLIELPPTDEHSCPKEFTPEIQAEIARVLACADSNQIMNMIFSASLKDEPTKLEKEKVRVFQAAPLALQYAIRKYFLPVARFLSLYPLISETAVGVNAHGPEWDELSRFMAKFGDDRCVAGDYSKYDLRMPAQLTLSAFAIMIEIAQLSRNYSSADIQRMQVIAHEVCTPLVAFNGTLIRFLGTNPSGQNMTVYINSIVNSLLHRICFFQVYPVSEMKKIGNELGLSRPARFRDLVALMTYGDDAKGSVRVGYDKFNHVSMANILAANDMVFTMPDKESEPVEFMSRFRADFLKRKDRYDEDLGVFVGSLEEDSIFKSLHSILKSKSAKPLEVCSQNIDGALREWFFHGREVFEMRREQMQEVSARADLPCRTLDEDFDHRVKVWKDKYVPHMGSTQSSLELESTASSFSDPFSDLSSLTEAVAEERELVDRVKAILGRPTYEEYVIIGQHIGAGDLFYESEGVALIVEVKRVTRRPSRFSREVVAQARKYSQVVSILRPDLTVYGITYTEYGFSLVECFGEPLFPARFADFLDSVPILF